MSLISIKNYCVLNICITFEFEGDGKTINMNLTEHCVQMYSMCPFNAVGVTRYRVLRGYTNNDYNIVVTWPLSRSYFLVISSSVICPVICAIYTNEIFLDYFDVFSSCWGGDIYWTKIWMYKMLVVFNIIVIRRH